MLYLAYDDVNAAHRLKVHSDGDFEVVDGDIRMASGHGIDFALTSDGTTMSSELLNDYEIGTFTPVLIGSSSNPTTNGAQAQAKYVKVGSTVHVTARLYWSSISGGSGDLQVAGFPFTSGTLTGSWWPGTLGYTSSSRS